MSPIWRYTINVPAGTKAVVNGEVADKRPLRVGRYTPVYYVSSAPYTPPVTSEAACNEGIVHKITVQLRLVLDEPELHTILAESGDSTCREVSTVSAQSVASLHQVEGAVRGALQTFIQGQSFFALQDPDAVKQKFAPQIHGLCKKANLLATVEACTDIAHQHPGEARLAELAVRAGKKEVTDAQGVRQTTYADALLGRIVDYFDKARREMDLRDLEARRQQKLNEVEIERTKAQNDVEIERIKASAGPELEKLRQASLVAQTASKIAARDQENALKAHEAKLRKDEQKWEYEAIQNNNEVLEVRAKYEADYKQKRLQEETDQKKKSQQDSLALEESRLIQEKKLAGMRADVTAATAKETDWNRQQKRLDIQLELEREKGLSSLRAEEKEQVASQILALAGKITLPSPDYSGVHTLFLGKEEHKTADRMADLLLLLLERVSGELIQSPVTRKPVVTPSRETA